MYAKHHTQLTPKTAPRSLTMAGWMTHKQEGGPSLASPETISGALNTCLELHQLGDGNFSCAGTKPAYVDADSGLVGILIGNPRWQTAQLRDTARQLGDAAALAAAYIKYGEKLTDHVRGSYAFALLDPTSATALLAVDKMGRVPLYYHNDGNTLLFGTSANSVRAMCPQAAPLSHQGLYNYVYFHMVPSPLPVFTGLHKLQPGSIARLKEGQVTTHRHWQPVFTEQASATRPALHEGLKTHLKQAVAACLPPTGKVGAFLSGGLDSSTVTGMLAELSDGPCDAYSIGFAAEGYDEMAFARITAEHFGARLHEYYVTPEDVVAALPLIASSYDEPFGNSSALPAYFCAKMAAADGVSLLLAGDGGDELFAGNERYAKQKTFEAYHLLPGILGNMVVEPLVRAAPAWVPLAEKARSYIEQANTPLPDRLQTYNFLHRHLANEVFREDFLAEVDIDLPLALLRNIYRAPASASSLNRMLYLDWQITLADNDLRKVSETCALAGVEVAYPMLDDDLVAFSLGIPSDWKLPGSKLRDFYKKALSGWLPEATLNKSKQGFGLPFGVWMRDHIPLQEIAYDNILKLKSRQIFQSTFLDHAISMHRDGHAAYFGELIWILCVLELWMSSHLGQSSSISGNKA